VGANESDNPISGELLQLELAAQSVQDNGSSANGLNVATLDLARANYLPHYCLIHYPYIALQEIVANLYIEAEQAVIADSFADASLLQSQADSLYQVAENLGFLITEVEQ